MCGQIKEGEMEREGGVAREARVRGIEGEGRKFGLPRWPRRGKDA